MIQKRISDLIGYGLKTGLIEEADKVYTVNGLLELFGLDEWEEIQSDRDATLTDILEDMLDYAAAHGLLAEDTVTYRDLFDTKIMGLLMPRPSEVRNKFRKLYREQGAQAATDYYYKLSCDSNYIRIDRISKDKKWIVIKLLVSSDEKKVLFISNNVNDTKYIDIINGFKCPIGSCFGKYFRLTVNNKDYGNGDIKSFVNKIEPLTPCEKEIINHAGKLLFEQFDNEMEDE